MKKFRNFSSALYTANEQHTMWNVLEGNRGVQLDATSSKTNAFWGFNDIPCLLKTGLNNWFSMNNI